MLINGLLRVYCKVPCRNSNTGSPQHPPVSPAAPAVTFLDLPASCESTSPSWTCQGDRQRPKVEKNGERPAAASPGPPLGPPTAASLQGRPCHRNPGRTRRSLVRLQSKPFGMAHLTSDTQGGSHIDVHVHKSGRMHLLFMYVCMCI